MLKYRGKVFFWFFLSHHWLTPQAVDHCHKNNVVHRDLKAENLLLDEDRGIKVRRPPPPFLFIYWIHSIFHHASPPSPFILTSQVIDFGLSNFYSKGWWSIFIVKWYSTSQRICEIFSVQSNCRISTILCFFIVIKLLGRIFTMMQSFDWVGSNMRTFCGSPTYCAPELMNKVKYEVRLFSLLTSWIYLVSDFFTFFLFFLFFYFHLSSPGTRGWRMVTRLYFVRAGCWLLTVQLRQPEELGEAPTPDFPCPVQAASLDVQRWGRFMHWNEPKKKSQCLTF